jgi:galactokinase
MSALERATAIHRSHWGDPHLIVRAPGRVNLIGEHTDYNQGFTMPMALPFDTVLAMSSDGDHRTGTITVESEGFGRALIDPGADPKSVTPWARHLAGVVALLAERGVAAGGWRVGIATDIPTGASLSSSAALEVAAITGLLARAGEAWAAIDVAMLGQRVENEIVGVPTGIMDQLISAGAAEGHASLMDCRSLTLDHRPLPAGVVVAVMDTGTRRILAEAAYRDRRANCIDAVSELGVVALRDATLEQVATISDPTTRRRAHHVVSENVRTLAAAEAMQRRDVIELGRLMSASHASLRDDYDVSGPALDQIVDIASEAPGCLGARMTGGGFAGCAVALVEQSRTDAFVAAVTDRFGFDGHRAQIWISAPAAGASVIEP